MLKKTIFFGIGICLSLNMLAEQGVDWKTAIALYNQGKHQEAQEIFVKLADAAATPQAKADSLCYVAFCLNGRKKYDEALEAAKKIEFRPVSVNTQMIIMGTKPKEIIEAFKDEDFSGWPESIKGEGYYRRGYSYSKLQNTDAAIKDLEKSVEFYPEDKKLLPLGTLAGIYEVMKDDQKALDTHLKIQALASSKATAFTINSYNNSTSACASILKRQGKYDDAVAELQKIDLEKSNGALKFQILKSFGEIYEVQGKKSEAIAKYKEAVAVKENVPPAYTEALEKKISSMSDK